MQQIFFYLSIIQGFIGQGIGIYLVLKGEYKPQRMTRFIYFLMSVILLGTMFAQESWDALGFALAQNIGGTIIFLLSFKYGMGGMNKSDIFTLFGAICSGVVWVLTSNPTLALVMGLLTDAIAFIPTLLKIWTHPFTEDWRFYLSDVFASSFSLMSLTRITLGDIVYPAYIFALNGIATIFILVSRKLVKRSEALAV